MRRQLHASIAYPLCKKLRSIKSNAENEFMSACRGMGALRVEVSIAGGHELDICPRIPDGLQCVVTLEAVH